MKRLILLVLFLMCTAIGMSYAAQSDSVAITVTITGALKSVDIKEATVARNMVIGTVVTLASMTVTNTSGGLTESYQIKASTGTGNDGKWTLSSAPGVNTAQVQAVLKADGSTAAIFGAEDTLTFAYQNCSATLCGDSATCGQNVLFSAPVRSMLIQISAPTGIDSGKETEVITVTINVI